MEAVKLNILDGPNYERDEQGWEHHGYVVELTYEGRRFETSWRQGLGITEDPTAESVIESVIMDCRGAWNSTGFEDWADDYGYDTDSRKAEALYNTIQEQAVMFSRLVGPERYQEIMNSRKDEEALAAELAGTVTA